MGNPCADSEISKPWLKPGRLTRMDYLDNLRVALVMLVVAHHAAQAYGPPDWWYFRGDRRSWLLATFSVVNGAFFMSLFFFVSAYFVPTSRDAKGTSPFVRGRFRRLGIPLVVGTLTIIPGLMYSYYNRYRDYPAISFWRYYRDVFLGFGERPEDWSGPSWPDLQFGHLWFIQHLLIYSLFYLICRWLAGHVVRIRGASAATRPMGIPGHGGLVALSLAVAAATFLIRLYYPLDTWVPLLGFIQAEPARLPQYAAFFTAGILACRNEWLHNLPRSTGYTWLALGIGLAGLPFVTGGIDSLGFDAGGATLAALAGTLYESFLCTGLCVGLVVLFREHFAGGHAFARSLAASSFALYIIHVPIVVALQVALAPADLPALLSFGVVAALATLISFPAADLLRRLPGFRSVL